MSQKYLSLSLPPTPLCLALEVIQRTALSLLRHGLCQGGLPATKMVASALKFVILQPFIPPSVASGDCPPGEHLDTPIREQVHLECSVVKCIDIAICF